MGMNILVSPTGFKESLEPHVAADCIEAGILRVVPDANVRKVPLVDGGEGFARALVAAKGGECRSCSVTGPVNQPVLSHYGFFRGKSGQKTAVIEMAAVAGLRLVPKGMRDPTATTTYGVGELIVAALDEGAEHIIIGCGDSGTSDGGVGMCQALGGRFLGRDGEELPIASGGRMLADLTDIDLSHLHPRLRHVAVDVLCNWKNVLCGKKGVARVYGPQKGATPEQVQLLSSAFDTYAAAVKRKIGLDVAHMPGGGASGGLGTGLLLLGARLRPRFEAVTEYFGIDNLFDDCQLVFTAEGELDYQTPQGKIPAEVATRAKRHGIPVIALAGTIGTKAHVNYAVGIDAFTSITQGPISLENAIRDAETLLTDCAERAMRMVIVGTSLPRNSPRVVAYKPARTRHIFLLSSLLGPLVPAAVYLWVALFSLIYFHTLI
jgi:glycerate kinase